MSEYTGYGGYDKADITPEFLKRNDGKLVWIRDDWLSMRGYALYGDSPNHALFDFAEHVAAVKEQARREGVEFSA